jgi:peroxidase
VNPSISNAFATAAFRFGHTIINPTLERLDETFKTISAGPLALREAFFAPERLLAEGGIDPVLRGLFAAPLKKPLTNQLLNKELTERLFHRAHDVSLDLAVMNIQRGRDHALPGYTEFRRFCNLTVPENWEDLLMDIGDQKVVDKLRKLYGHPGNIDLWVGGIVEKRMPDALIGPTFSCIIGDQFRRLRDGDRFWYENAGVFTPLQLQQIKKTSLAKVLCNNGDAIDRVQEDPFLFVGTDGKRFRQCDSLPDVAIKMWMSCCDETCSAANAPTSEPSARKRRSHHLYGHPLTNKTCDYNGEMKKANETWRIERCTSCTCQDGVVSCTLEKGCL